MSLFSQHAFRTFVMVFPALGLAVSAAAQTQPADPSSQTLRLSISAFGGYDTDVTGVGAQPEATASAPYGGTRASLAYRVRSKKITFSAQGGGDSRHYRTDEPIAAASYDGGAVFGADVTSRLSVGASAQAAYSPRFMFSLLPVAGDIATDVLPPSLDYGLSAQKTVNYATRANASFRVSRRSSFNASVGRSAYRFLDNDIEMRSRSYAAGYSYSLTRYATLRAGYGETTAEYPTVGIAEARRYKQRNYDVGLNYSRPLSLSRRTTISFGSGSSAIDDGQRTLYNVTGNAALNHQIGRSWETGVVYARGLGVVGGFGEPFFADSVSANLRGRINSKLTVMTSAGFANGNIGLGSRANDYESFQASSRLEMALRRDRVGLYGEYFFYGYRFQDATSSVVPIPQRVNRHGVRVGLIFRFPLLQERTPRVTR